MKVARFLIAEMRPYTTTESPEFRDLIKECEARYSFPSRATFGERVVPMMYDVVAERLKMELKESGAVAITCDAWTSRATESYITVTCHYIDGDFKLQSNVLQTRAMNDSHTGVNTAAVLAEVEAEWGCQVRSLTTDNARNMKVAAREANMMHIGCFAHTINLAANKATDLKPVSRLLGIMKSIVNYFHRSTIASAVLKEKQKLLQLPEHKLINDVKTRWNSSYMMVERFLEQQVAVLAALTDDRIKRQKDATTLENLTSEELRNAEDFVSLMQPMLHATLAISEDSKPTGSLVLPLLEKLLKKYQVNETDSKFEEHVKCAIVGNLRDRYTDEVQLTFLQEVTALDPRFKHQVSFATWDRLADCIVNTKQVYIYISLNIL